MSSDDLVAQLEVEDWPTPRTEAGRALVAILATAVGSVSAAQLIIEVEAAALATLEPYDARGHAELEPVLTYLGRTERRLDADGLRDIEGAEG